MLKLNSEQGRILIYGAVIAVALFLAGLAVAGDEKKSESVGVGQSGVVVWRGDTESLALLRSNGVVAAEEPADRDKDPYPWLHAGREGTAPGGQEKKDKDGSRDSSGKNEKMEAGKQEENAEISKVIYLTFDDGPSHNTGKILDTLAQFDAKATFFLIGENLTECGIEYAKRAVSEGHLLGMHTQTHCYNKIYASKEAFLKDYNTLAKQFIELFGACPVCFRFPGGSCSSYINPIRKELKKELSERGFLCYDWNVSGEDAVGTPTAASIKKNIFRQVYSVENPIILLHDSPCNQLTAEVLPEILERLSEEGYVFHTLQEREPYQFPW